MMEKFFLVLFYLFIFLSQIIYFLRQINNFLASFVALQSWQKIKKKIQ